MSEQEYKDPTGVSCILVEDGEIKPISLDEAMKQVKAGKLENPEPNVFVTVSKDEKPRKRRADKGKDDTETAGDQEYETRDMSARNKKSDG